MFWLLASVEGALEYPCNAPPVGCVKDKGRRSFITLEMATAVAERYSAISVPGKEFRDDWFTFLKKLQLPPDFEVMARPLFRPLSRDFVEGCPSRKVA